MADYYEILGVGKDASIDEIKRAYRKLARKMHPDVAGPGSEEQFKEVTRAYETLSDPEKKQRYDMGGDSIFSGMGSMGDFGGFSDIFETFFGGGQGASGPSPRGRRGQNSLTVLNITLEDVVFGAAKTVSVDMAVTCPTCEGSCCKPGTTPRTCSVCGGRGSVQRMTRSFLGQVMTTTPCTACSGHGTVIADPCEECAGEGRVRTRVEHRVNVPAGVEEGTRIRLVGKGEAGPGGGPHGDLYIEIRVKPHPVFVRQGHDLHASITIPMTTAVLGTTFTFDTFDGPQDVRIDPGTQPHDTITLDGLGAGVLHRKRRGNLYIHVNVTIPTRLDAEQKDLVRHLAMLRSEDHAKPVVQDESSGVFSRLRDKFAGRG